MISQVDIGFGRIGNLDTYETEISEDCFGVEYLGWGRWDFEWLQGLNLPDGDAVSLIEEYGISHLRWPGGIPAEEPFGGNAAGPGLKDYTLEDLRLEGYPDGAVSGETVPVYDLADPNFVNWYYYTGGLDRADYDEDQERPGLSDIISAAEGMGIESLAIVVPTSRYAARMFDPDDTGDLDTDDVITSVVAQAASDMSFFLDNLKDAMDDHNANFDVTLELGSEYYATGLWKHFFKNGHEFDLSDSEIQSNLLTAFGLVFATQTAVIADFEDQTGFDINVAVQLGRTQANNTETDGSALDQEFFIDAFTWLKDFWSEASEIQPEYSNDVLGNEVLEGLISEVDLGIWHRYISEWDNLDDHLTQDQSPGDENEGGRLTVSEMLEMWEHAGAGGEDGELGLLAGWNSPVVGSHDLIDSRVCPVMTLELFSQLVTAGMEYSSVYGWQSNKIGALTNANSETMGGQIFGMMAENLSGTFLLEGFEKNSQLAPDASDEYADSDGDGWFDPIGERDQVNEYHFVNSYKAVSYFVVGALSDDNGLDFSMSYQNAHISHVETTSLWLDPSDAEDHAVYSLLPNGTISDQLLGYSGVVEDIQHTMEAEDDGDTTLSFEFLHDYQTVQLVAYFQTVFATEDYDMNLIEIEAQPYVTEVWLGEADTSEAITVSGNSERNTIHGHDGVNTLFGGDGKDILYGGDGNDILSCGRGETADYYRSDILDGGLGDDTYLIDASEDNTNVRIVEDEDSGMDSVHINGLTLGDITDTSVLTRQGVTWLELHWEDGSIRLSDLGSNIERITFDDGTQTQIAVVEDNAPEFLLSNGSSDLVVGSHVGDRIDAGGASDVVVGGGGNDLLIGGGGSDNLFGGAGDDCFWGNQGDDIIRGGLGQNTVFAGKGDDIIIENGSDSILRGDLGSDTYVIEGGFGGTDRILGFEIGQDTIDLSFFDGIELEDIGIEFHDGGKKLVVELSDILDADDLVIQLSEGEFTEDDLPDMFVF